MTCEHKKDKSEKYKTPKKWYETVFFKYALSNTDPSTPVFRVSAEGRFHGILDTSHTTLTQENQDSEKSCIKETCLN